VGEELNIDSAYNKSC